MTSECIQCGGRAGYDFWLVEVDRIKNTPNKGTAFQIVTP